MFKVQRLARPGAVAAAILLVDLAWFGAAQAHAAASPAPSGAVVVGASAGACGGTVPQYTTISAAVAAAAAGETIYVCPGVYDESVSINKSITLLGAQYGVAANDPSTRTDASAESVIDSPVVADPSGSGTTATSAIIYTAATAGTVNGFTIEGGTGSNNQAIPGISGLSGSGTGAFDFVDNILTDNGEGMQFSTGGTATPASTVSGNRFVTNNNDPSDGKSGSGVFLSNGTADNLTISDNYFDDNSGNGDVNTTGEGGCSAGVSSGNDSVGLVIDDNVSVHDDADGSNFAVIFCTDGAKVNDNTVTYTDANDPSASSAIYLGGGNSNLTVSGNTLAGGISAAGISFNADFYPEGAGDTITGNTISSHSNGIVVRGSNSAVAGNNYPGASDFTISDNTVTGSATDGIWVQGGSAGVVTGNVASGSGSYDCQDSTTGSATAGTSDTWTSDSGATSSPAGLCSSPVVQAPEAPAAIALPATMVAVVGGVVVVRRRRQRRAA